MKNRAILLSDKIENLKSVDFSLSDDRKKKIESFLFDGDKKRCALAEVLIMRGLKEFGYNISDVKYTYNEYGKPYFRDLPDIYFNISHSADYVVCVLANCEIGIDIELIAPISLDIAKHFFSPNEYELVANCSSKDERIDNFYKLWTKKEAYVKATGKGMVCPFNSFDITKDFQYNFIEIDKFEGYKCAVCTKDPLNELIIR